MFSWFIHELQMMLLIVSCLLGLLFFLAFKFSKSHPTTALKGAGMLWNWMKK